MAKSWSKEWLNYVDRNKVTPFPLQLANCDRLEKNNAVYIFDEVGSGKTISAGLMALNYLYNHSNAKVLVITTSQLADKDDEPGPFKQLWLDKLPFQDKQFPPRWQFGRRIKVINHDYRNIRKENEHKRGWTRNGYMTFENNWDLIIIDEAHMFLNKNNRYRELTGEKDEGKPAPGGKITAQKVVFLTATPIKTDLKDLQVYSRIARLITHSGGCNTNLECYTCFDDAKIKGTSTVLFEAAATGPSRQKFDFDTGNPGRV